MLIPCVHAFVIQGNLDRILPLVLAAVCAWGVAYLLVTCSVVILRIRRPDLPRASIAVVPAAANRLQHGIVLAIVYITPPGMNPRDVYIPFGMHDGLTAAYALFWTLCVQKVNPFKPVPVEQGWKPPSPKRKTRRRSLIGLLPSLNRVWRRQPAGYRPGRRSRLAQNLAALCLRRLAPCQLRLDAAAGAGD